MIALRVALRRSARREGFAIIASKPPPETYWIHGERLSQTLVVAGKPAATVLPALNRAEILDPKGGPPRIIAAPWSKSAYDMVEEQFGYTNVRLVPTPGGQEDIRTLAERSAANFRAMVRPENEAHRSVMDALTALDARQRHAPDDEQAREARLQLELAVHSIDANAGRWTDHATLRTLAAKQALSGDQGNSSKWNAWLECERALTAAHLYNRPERTIEKQPDAPAPLPEEEFNVFRNRSHARDRGRDRD